MVEERPLQATKKFWQTETAQRRDLPAFFHWPRLCLLNRLCLCASGSVSCCAREFSLLHQPLDLQAVATDRKRERPAPHIETLQSRQARPQSCLFVIMHVTCNIPFILPQSWPLRRTHFHQRSGPRSSSAHRSRRLWPSRESALCFLLRFAKYCFEA